MEVTPSTPPKSSRARGKTKTGDTAATPAAPRKSRSRKIASVAGEPQAPAPMAAAHKPTEDELRGLIAKEAYFLAVERNFAPGGELDDWLEAERRVLART